MSKASQYDVLFGPVGILNTLIAVSGVLPDATTHATTFSSFLSCAPGCCALLVRLHKRTPPLLVVPHDPGAHAFQDH